VGEPEARERESLANVRSVERAVSILTTLADQARPLGVAEIAGYVQLHPATVHRLLTTMVRLGWVDHPDSSRYRLGLRMLGVAALGVAQSPLLSSSRDILSRLAEASGWSTYLSVLIGRRVVDLARSAGRLSQAAPTFEFDPGRSHPAYANAAGKLLLAYKPAAERLQLLGAEPLRGLTPFTLTDLDDLEDEFDSIRSKAFATDRGEQWDFIKGAAVPVFGPDNEVVAALLTIGRFDLTPDTEIWFRQEMTLLAQELSHRLEMLGE
jgi:IclR family acetate operon transcriptional repressor